MRCFSVRNILAVFHSYQVSQKENENNGLNGWHVEGGCKVVPEEDHNPILHVVHGIEGVFRVDATHAEGTVHHALRF